MQVGSRSTTGMGAEYGRARERRREGEGERSQETTRSACAFCRLPSFLAEKSTLELLLAIAGNTQGLRDRGAAHTWMSTAARLSEHDFYGL